MHLNNKDSFVIYRHPKSDDLFYIKGEWQTINKFKKSNSFIFSPFKGETQEIIGIKKNIKQKISISNDIIQNTSTFSKEQYINLAKEYIGLCKNKAIEKIILSRVRVAENKTSDLFLLFEKLCNTYDHSFNYVLNHPNYGMWMGASPEVLITNSNNNSYKTIALAGSKKWGNNIVWGNKEIEEQQYVKVYIENILNNHSKNVQCTNDLETIKAGNIAHLKSTFHFSLNSSVFNLIQDLHPTPAVCGIPMKITKDLIQKHEIHNRELYTGYIGEQNHTSTSLYVNLRCMKITSNKFSIYVGGGITSKSDPQEEWEETEIKAQTMLSLIEN